MIVRPYTLVNDDGEPAGTVFLCVDCLDNYEDDPHTPVIDGPTAEGAEGACAYKYHGVKDLPPEQWAALGDLWACATGAYDRADEGLPLAPVDIRRLRGACRRFLAATETQK